VLDNIFEHIPLYLSHSDVMKHVDLRAKYTCAKNSMREIFATTPLTDEEIRKEIHNLSLMHLYQKSYIKRSIYMRSMHTREVEEYILFLEEEIAIRKKRLLL
jgi:hypothetical protein